MQITAAMVKELRELTGAGMMECKKALTEAGGNTEAAIEWMRKNGLAKADKKAGRVAAEGVIALATAKDQKAACMIEINCETDFVARGDDFRNFVDQVSAVALEKAPADLDALLKLPLKDGTVIETQRKALVAKIGENIQIRRFVRIASQGVVGAYSHGGRIGVLVEMVGGDINLAKDIAMHVAASRPVCVSENDVPAEHLQKEKEILVAQAAQSGKTGDIVEKMVQGRLKKYLAEVTLLGQPFVKDPDQSVGKLLKAAAATVKSFHRFEVGEGIEKKEENFAEEVMAAVRAG
ncbi:MAG TPA: translation elongation factor Ts [Gammaproteobacteria bacterium]|nr:translation elongation factor Ts [Gammaproteobacteria bacterium]